MNNLIITLLAGLSTLLGSFMICFKNKNKIIKNSLSFTSGVMFSICIIDLIPNSFILINKYFLFIPTVLFILLFISIGIVINMIIEKYIKTEDNLYKIGILSIISLTLHNIPEGIITFITSSININIGISLSIAVALHNIPEGILISIPIYYTSKSRLKAFFYTFISGISEFIGGLIGYILYNKITINYNLGFIYSLISGLMLYISIYEIPFLLKNYDKKGRVGYFLLGIIIILITHLFLN